MSQICSPTSPQMNLRTHGSIIRGGLAEEIRCVCFSARSLATLYLQVLTWLAWLAPICLQTRSTVFWDSG